jgi:hypothetical protein
MLDPKKTCERKALLKLIGELSAEIYEREGADQECVLEVLKEKNRQAIEERTNPEKNPRLQ